MSGAIRSRGNRASSRAGRRLVAQFEALGYAMDRTIKGESAGSWVSTREARVLEGRWFVGGKEKKRPWDKGATRSEHKDAARGHNCEFRIYSVVSVVKGGISAGTR